MTSITGAACYFAQPLLSRGAHDSNTAFALARAMQRSATQRNTTQRIRDTKSRLPVARARGRVVSFPRVLISDPAFPFLLAIPIGERGLPPSLPPAHLIRGALDCGRDRDQTAATRRVVQAGTKAASSIRSRASLYLARRRRDIIIATIARARAERQI